MQPLRQGSLLQGEKYRIESTLGNGGFGITYLATQDILDRKVAVKEFFFGDFCERNGDTSQVTLGTQSNHDIVERFLVKFIKEARTISKLHHPAIIPIYDVFRENGTAYYVMEYIEGESLGDMVKRRGFLPQDEALSYIRSVGDALTYIHQRNITHLDVKPVNIMFRRSDRQVILIDFGVAKQYDEMTNEGTTTTPVGISHGYSPAEQYKKDGVQTFSPQSDVYSLAATLFKLLTGKTPPEATEIPDVGLPVEELRQKNVSESVISAIEKAMKPRSIRTQSIAEFLSNLEAVNSGVSSDEESDETSVILDSEPTPKPNVMPQSAPQPNPMLQPASKSRPKWLYFSVIAGFLVCLAIVIIVVSSKKDSDPVPKENVVETMKVKGKSLTIPLGICTYTGEVDSLGVPNGFGEARFNDGRIYKGNFVHGTAEDSNAHFTYENGDTYEGSFKNNGFYQGRYTIQGDGSYFVGTFKDGNPNRGVWYDKTGKKIE